MTEVAVVVVRQTYKFTTGFRFTTPVVNHLTNIGVYDSRIKKFLAIIENVRGDKGGFVGNYVSVD